jgi:hypothetical protein
VEESIWGYVLSSAERESLRMSSAAELQTAGQFAIPDLADPPNWQSRRDQESLAGPSTGSAKAH